VLHQPRQGALGDPRDPFALKAVETGDKMKKKRNISKNLLKEI